MVRALVLFVVLLLGAVGGAWLSLTLATLLLEPAERIAFALLALLGAAFVGWKIL
jgi:hypothetical protein